jgi:hypothetical protein
VILTVTDRSTGKPVDSFSTLCLTDDKGTFGQVNKGQVRVPPNADFVLLVRAKGYEPWFYSDRANPSRTSLQLESGEQRAIAVELEPR